MGRLKTGSTQPLAGVIVSTTVEGLEKIAITDAKGKYEIKLPTGDYQFNFTSEATEALVIEKKVRPGVMGRLSVELAPAVESAAPTVMPIVPQPSTSELLRDAMEEISVEEPNDVEVVE